MGHEGADIGRDACFELFVEDQALEEVKRRKDAACT